MPIYVPLLLFFFLLLGVFFVVWGGGCVISFSLLFFLCLFVGFFVVVYCFVFAGGALCRQATYGQSLQKIFTDCLENET